MSVRAKFQLQNDVAVLETAREVVIRSPTLRDALNDHLSKWRSIDGNNDKMGYHIDDVRLAKEALDNLAVALRAS